MRLLLLLSALLSALSGFGGARAQAQPAVAASSAVAGATAGVVLARRVPLRFAGVSPPSLSSTVLTATPMLVSAVIARRPFVERRRE
ncbi:MAG: hypothetical protein ACRYFW_08070 [Janthinobacterium lividum]